MELEIFSLQVPLSQSEIYISDILDDICKKMTDYVRATKKSNNRLTIFNIMSQSGGMNPQMSKVDIIQDGDLNKSLEHYVSSVCLYLVQFDQYIPVRYNLYVYLQCSGIVEEFEDDIVSLYIDNIKNKKEKLCIGISNICNQNYIDNDDEDDDSDDINDTNDAANPIKSILKDKTEL